MNERVKLTFGLACTLVLAMASPALAARVIVTLTTETDAAAAATSATAAGATITHVLHHGYSGKLPGKLIKQLRSDATVTSIERDRKVKLAQSMCTVQSPVPNWGLDRISQRSLPLDGEYAYEHQGANRNVYVLDTGIDTSNPDFGSRAVWGVDVIDGTQQDCNGHGTAVAGIVGGTAYGAAKQVSLTAVRVLNCKGVGFASDVVAGLEWATDNHTNSDTRPSVAVLALAGKLSNALNAAANAASASGLVTIVAAGNRHDDACEYSPASATGVISVAASDINDQIASFSNGGTCVGLFAPGVDITSDSLESTTASFSGTSMSAAFVAGVAALILDEHPTWTFEQVKANLYDQTTKGVIAGMSKAPSSTNQLLFSACDI